MPVHWKPGARLVAMAVKQLHQCGDRYALCTYVYWRGQGTALVLECV